MMTQSERIFLPLWKKIILIIISTIFLAIELLLLFAVLDVSFTYSFSSIKWIYFLTLGISICFCIYIMYRPMSANYKLIWVTLILILPLPFCFLYLFNSSSRRLSKRKMAKVENALKHFNNVGVLNKLKLENKDAANLCSIVQYSAYAPVYDNTTVLFFSDCEKKFYDLLNETKKAKHYIYIESFIVANGFLMDNLYEVLKERGEAGVEIKILYDDVGSRGVMTQKLLKKLAEIKNCNITNYEPLGININPVVNNRNHRKVYIIDGIVSYCGGDNLADEYIHKKQRFGYWRDNCLKFVGEATKTFVIDFIEMWYLSTRNVLQIDYKPEYKNDFKGYVMPFSDGPANKGYPAYDLFMGLISTAKSYIYISTPYFIIDDPMISLISLKAKSGVKVVLLTPAIPDKKSVFYMTRGNYRELLKSGAIIYEYTPGFNHAKNIIVDDIYAFGGTINMDYRSLFLHYECGSLLLFNPEISAMKKDYEAAISVSEEITMDKWIKRPWYQKLIAFILNIFAPMF